MKNQKGFTLIELMIGITIGLIVLVGAEQVFVTTLQANIAGTKQQRFEQTIQVLMGSMVSEIRRAGYTSPGSALTLQTNGKYFLVATTANCITLSHSTPEAAQVFYGYQLANNTVYYWNSTTTNGDCTTKTGWIAVTDPAQIKVTTMSFTAAGATGALINIRLVATAVGLTVQGGAAVTRDSTVSVRIRNA